ncbi:MAG: PH domain-containing protein [Thermoprotei archaeon]
MEYVFKILIPSYVWIFVVVIAIILVTVLLLLVIPIVGFTIKVSRNSIIASSPIMYRITINRDSVERIYTADLDQHPELKPVIRTFGTAILGYKLGWFKLSNGAKAFLAISSNRVVVIELQDGTYVILSPENVEEFAKKLQELEWIK